MPETFDAYFKWMGIPPAQQPPDHYRLLGIPPFTSDADVIENAADQRMAHVRTFASGQHAGDSQRILNEISSAKVTLLNCETRATYDAILRDELSPRHEVALAGPQAIRQPPPRVSRAQELRIRSKASLPTWVIITICGTGLVSMLVLAGAFAMFLFADWTPVVTRPDADGPPLATPTVTNDDADATSHVADAQSSAKNTMADDAGDDNNITPGNISTNFEQHAHKPNGDVETLAVADTISIETTTNRVEKAAAPDEAARKSAERKVEDVFGEEIQQATSEAQIRALAEKLIQVGERTDELPIRFALYQRAIEIAKELGDAEVAFRAVDALDASFQGDALRLKASVLHGVSLQLRRGKGHVDLAAYFDSVFEEALAADRFEIAQPLTEVALQSAIKSGDGDLRKAAVTRVNEVKRLANAFAEVKTALATLASKPTDPDANLIAGQYYCFTRDNWSRGLPNLALASDERLKALAEEELNDAPDAVKLGDGWWQVGEALDEPQAFNVKKRAAEHYRRALPSLSGFAKKQVEKRLSELPAAEPLEKMVDLIAISDPAKQGEKGRWRMVDGNLVCTNLEDASFFNPPYAPPREYDLQVGVTRTHNGPRGASDTHVRLPHGENCHTFGIRTSKDGTTSLSFWGEKPFGAPPLGVTFRPGFELGKRYTLLFRVRDEGAQVSLDGRALITVDDYALLRNSDDGIGVGSFQNQTVFHELVVREIMPAQASSVHQPRPAIALFNGTDLTGWKYMPIAYSKSKTNKTWGVDRQQKALISIGGDEFNDLGTIDSYGDFKLSLQWRFRPGGPVNPNGSGIVVRASGMDDLKHNPRGIEIDLRPNFDVKQSIGTGCLLAYATPLKNHEVAVDGKDQRRLGWLQAPGLKEGEGWNECVVTCQGDSLVVEMNGDVINRAWGIEIPRGNIVLRNQKTAVEFRDIRLVELPARALSLPPEN